MKRRDFFKSATTGMLSLGGAWASLPLLGKPQMPIMGRPHNTTNKLTAYYFRAHMYTLVPEQIEQDMAYMAEIGTQYVAVAILEQDLFAAVENVAMIAKIAKKYGMEMLLVPSRWGGLVAGAPKVPSLFSVKNPDTWALGKDGKPYDSGVSGVISSIYHPKTLEFVQQHIAQCFELWDWAGVIWDEPKVFFIDHHPMALEQTDGEWNKHLTACARFFGQANIAIKKANPAAFTSLFVYAQSPNEVLEAISKTEKLDYFGADGRPYPDEAGGTPEGKGKNLIDQGERFIDVVQDSEAKTVFLIENHNMPAADNLLMDKYLPKVLNLNPDHLIYYYYPRNLEKPTENMEIIKKHLQGWL